MALVRKISFSRSKSISLNEEEVPVFGGIVRSYSLGRKRVVCSNESMCLDSDIGATPLKRQCSGAIAIGDFASEKSHLESLPQDILIRIVCGVNHEDLEQLFPVSRTICGAALVAKRLHFPFTTPRKTPVFPTSDEVKTPGAPKISRPRRSLNSKHLASISANLFVSDSESESTECHSDLTEEDEV